MRTFRGQKIPKKRRRRFTVHLDLLEGKMAQDKKKSKVNGKEKKEKPKKLPPIKESPQENPITKQQSRDCMKCIQIASVVVESEEIDEILRSVNKEISKKPQPAPTVLVPGLGRIIPIPGSEPVTTPFCTVCSGTKTPDTVPQYCPPEPCCQLEKEIYLDPDPEINEEEEETPNFIDNGYNTKPPKIVLGVDGEPIFESDSDDEREEFSVLRVRSPPIVHITPPRLMARNEFLYHVNVIGKDGVLEVDRLDENHPLPNCRLREIETDKYWMQFFKGGTLTDTCCAEVFDVKSLESLNFMDNAHASFSLKACSLPELEEHELGKCGHCGGPSERRASYPRKSSPRKSSLQGSSPKASLPGEPLPKTSLPKTSLPKTSLPGASLPGASLPKTSLPGASLPKTSLPGAPLARASLPKPSSPKTSLPGAPLARASLPKPSSPKTSLPGASSPSASSPPKS